MLVHIHLDQLTLSPKNVRRTETETAQDEMKSSLLHHGLQQNLVVVAQSEQAYAVIAGGRRLKALKALAEEGQIIPNIGADWQIPCQVIEADNATEVSLVENTVRVAMHPADQYEAWSRMVDEGKSPADVALRFGVSEQAVRRRLKLASLAPELMDAFRAAEISHENLMVFTLTDDHARQLDVWEQVRHSYNLSPHYIRRLLTEGAVRSDSKLALFVGEEAYEEAGGTITHDLFSEYSYFENAALLESLALRKLEAQIEPLRQEWAFVHAGLEPDYSAMRDYQDILPQIIGAPEELERAYHDAQVRYEELQSGDYDAEEEDEEALQEEFEQLEEQLETFQKELQQYWVYTDEQKQQSGCFVHLNQEGQLDIRHAMQKRTSTATGRFVTPNEDGTGVGDGDNPVDATESVYSRSLVSDLAIYRTQILQAALGDDFPAAFDLMAYSLCVKLFNADGLNILERATNGMGYFRSPLNISLMPYSTRTSLQDADSTPAGIKVSQQFDGLSLQWLRLASTQLQFATFCALPIEEKHKLFAFCIARNLHEGLAGRMPEELEVVASRLGVQAHETWRPDESSFFKRLKKPHLLALITGVIGAHWCSRMADQKKSQIAGWLGRVFAGNPAATAGMDGATLERIRTWMPAHMGYSTELSDGVIPDTGNVVVLTSEAEEEEEALPDWMNDLESAA